MFSAALGRQTNPNWKAFYVLTEKPVFSKILRAILNSYNDPRLHYLPVDGRLLGKVTTVILILIFAGSSGFSSYFSYFSKIKHYIGRIYRNYGGELRSQLAAAAQRVPLHLHHVGEPRVRLRSGQQRVDRPPHRRHTQPA